jgi:predicted DNA-binding transcriptional regulator AlpA
MPKKIPPAPPAAIVAALTTPVEQRRLIGKAEVVRRLGVSYPTIWLWMRNGTFPRARKLGGKTCWLESDIEQWIDEMPVVALKGDDDDQA